MSLALMSALFVLSLLQKGDGPNLALSVESGLYQFEPATIQLRIRVRPDADNRVLTVGLVSEGFATSSDEQLDGTEARVTRWRVFKDVPVGDYQAVAYVARVTGDPWLARAPVYVLGTQ